MLSIALLALINIQSPDQIFENPECLPSRLVILKKLNAHAYEARVSGAWPAIVATISELKHDGLNILFVRKVAVKTLPTTNGFSQEYMILEQCKGNQ